MPRRYAAIGQRQYSAGKTLAALTGATTIRACVEYICITCYDTPGDHVVDIKIQRHSADGSGGSTFTPLPFDPACPASACTFRHGAMTDPTLTANAFLLQKAHNTRAAWENWFGDQPLVIPASSGAGLSAVMITSDATPNESCTMHWYE